MAQEPIVPINITDVQAEETNVNWYADGERGSAEVLNRPIKEVAAVVNETVAEVNRINASSAQPGGLATLDGAGKIPATQLPSFVDDVLEFSTLSAFPAAGEQGKIYVALDTNKTYRWSGSTYIYITSGAVDSVAGKTGVVELVKADVGLANVDNTSDADKPVSTAQQSALDLKANASHSHSAATTSAAGYMSAADKAKLDGIASGANAYSLPAASSGALGGLKARISGTTLYLRNDGSNA